MSELTPKSTEPYYEEEVSPEVELERAQARRAEREPKKPDPPPPASAGIPEIDRFFSFFPDSRLVYEKSEKGVMGWSVRTFYRQNPYYSMEPTLGAAMASIQEQIRGRLDSSSDYHKRCIREEDELRAKLNSFAEGRPVGQPGGGGS